MNRKRIRVSVALAFALAAEPLTAANADPAYVAFPPFWPFITIGAIVEAATTPARPLCSPCYCAPSPCYYVPPSPCYAPPGRPPPYYPPGYCAGPYYVPR